MFSQFFVQLLVSSISVGMHPDVDILFVNTCVGWLCQRQIQVLWDFVFVANCRRPGLAPPSPRTHLLVNGPSIYVEDVGVDRSHSWFVALSPWLRIMLCQSHKRTVGVLENEC